MQKSEVHYDVNSTLLQDNLLKQYWLFYLQWISSELWYKRISLWNKRCIPEILANASELFSKVEGYITWYVRPGHTSFHITIIQGSTRKGWSSVCLCFIVTWKHHKCRSLCLCQQCFLMSESSLYTWCSVFTSLTTS